ncbi:hypothetical protein QBC38DRAFT_548790 [Podospora fimiseda]|uniref:Uncharacterized protein n=1 Tax=Podospora fimiseda TaxID=252190 RepID=A0AAN6YRY1_9PEZI|nr:hypothetical protein QBC38DRAFT_548790 [Podospora fimiseda]
MSKKRKWKNEKKLNKVNRVPFVVLPFYISGMHPTRMESFGHGRLFEGPSTGKRPIILQISSSRQTQSIPQNAVQGFPAWLVLVAVGLEDELLMFVVLPLVVTGVVSMGGSGCLWYGREVVAGFVESSVDVGILGKGEKVGDEVEEARSRSTKDDDEEEGRSTEAAGSVDSGIVYVPLRLLSLINEFIILEDIPVATKLPATLADIATTSVATQTRMKNLILFIDYYLVRWWLSNFESAIGRTVHGKRANGTRANCHKNSVRLKGQENEKNHKSKIAGIE